MAAHTSSDPEESVRPKCHFHLAHVRNENCQVMTRLRWRRIVSCSKEWLDLTGVEKEMAVSIQHLLDLPFDNILSANPALGFHATCYRRYIDAKRISAAKKQRERTTETAEVAPTHNVEKKLRRSREGPVRSNPVLPVKCIICDKVDNFVMRHNKRVRDRLSKAETEDAGVYYFFKKYMSLARMTFFSAEM